ncbi:TetR family transcriptional regulator [Ottowia sp. GY511]|uniref:TetR family transcriptional regulator n=1 Tax=Ottowia flava TaxID=2675430 RepID=A0ABW4KYQ7_9BURK|nr:TetR family transcriptional regulator [Ottowia sp. GY511]TXK27332.1 TetR family transcriptional regulator [Ottowia sp. GY511]
MARRTKEDALATRDALLDAAERVFGRRGVARTSLAEIAEDAGLTRGAVYWHFKDKADLFTAMMDRVTLPLDASMARLAEVERDPLIQLLERVHEAVVVIATDERTRRVLEIGCLMVEQVAEMGSLRDREVQKQRLGIQMLTQSIQRAADYHRVTLPAPSETLAHGLYGLAHGLVVQWLLDRSFDLRTTTLTAVDAYLSGLGFDLSQARAQCTAHNQG